jgi:GT2 family glycosyltransferase
VKTSNVQALPALAARLSPDLSICIVNWNCRDYLRSLLSSIEPEREKVTVEVIVVDNASTDDSASMVKMEFPDVHLICNPCHEGLASCNNRAAERAGGDLLLFLNNDTVIPSGALATLVEFFAQHRDVCGVMPAIVEPSGKVQETVRKALRFRAMLHRVLFLRWTRMFRSAEREFRQVNFDLKRSSYVEHVVGPALMVRRSHFMSIGGYDEAFEFGLEANDLSLRLGRLGRLYYLAEVQVIHWGGVATRLDEAFAYRCREFSHAYYLRKHCSPWAARLYKLLVTFDMPLRVGILALRWLGQKLVGDTEKASRNYYRLAAAAQFLFWKLPHFWTS